MTAYHLVRGLVLLGLVVLAAACCGCDKQRVGSGESVVGTWESVGGGERLEFLDDGNLYFWQEGSNPPMFSRKILADSTNSSEKWTMLEDGRVMIESGGRVFRGMVYENAIVLPRSTEDTTVFWRTFSADRPVDEPDVRGVALGLPEPSGYLSDLAGVVDPASRDSITSLATELREKTGVQLAVVTLRNLVGNDFSMAGAEFMRYWGVGRRLGDDDGVVLLVSPDDRKVNIAVGEGLRWGVLPDNLCRFIVSRVMGAYLSAGRYGAGLLAGARAIAGAIPTEGGAMVSGSIPPPVEWRNGSLGTYLKRHHDGSRVSMEIAAAPSRRTADNMRGVMLKVLKSTEASVPLAPGGGDFAAKCDMDWGAFKGFGLGRFGKDGCVGTASLRGTYSRQRSSGGAWHDSTLTLKARAGYERVDGGWILRGLVVGPSDYESFIMKTDLSEPVPK